MKSIAIFGGTFDPVHLGHMELVMAAKQVADVDQVVFMPCWQSPFKGRAIATGEQRYKMLQLAIEHQGIGAWATVSDFEIKRSKPSYSWQTVKHYRDLMPDFDLHWIVGTDQWRMIEDWAEADKLRQWLTFIVLTRDGVEVESRDGWSHQAVEFSHPASATKIRERFSSYGVDWLPNSIYNFCIHNNIY